MVPLPFSHKQYVRFVGRKAKHHGGLRTDHRHYQVWSKLKVTNLDATYAILVALFCLDRGRPARHPVCMLRCCLAMMLCGKTSFDEWVALMRDDPFYALISGFDPTDVPGVGTFYDFQDRLLHRPRQSRTTKRRPYRRRNQRDKTKQHQDKNDLRPHQGIVKRLADRILARRPDRPTPLAAVLEGFGDFSALPRWEQTLQPLFFTCFVSRSIDLNLIDLLNLHVAADGTKLPTWANPWGKKLCDCDNRDKKREDRCRCQRAYNDPLALWGWDSYRECWVYGHSCYELTAYNLQHTCQLPLLLTMADCNRHDSVLGLVTLYHAHQTFGLPIQTAALDAAHDALGFYRLGVERWQMALVIPINERNQDNLKYAGPLRLEDGLPICPADQPMKCWDFCPDRMRLSGVVRWPPPRRPLTSALAPTSTTTAPAQPMAGSSTPTLKRITAPPSSPETPSSGNATTTPAPVPNVPSSARSTTSTCAKPRLPAATAGSSA